MAEDRTGIIHKTIIGDLDQIKGYEKRGLFFFFKKLYIEVYNQTKYFLESTASITILTYLNNNWYIN